MNIDNPKPARIIYHERKYNFEHAKSFDLDGDAYKLFIFEITLDLITMIGDIVNSGDVISKLFINDPLVN